MLYFLLILIKSFGMDVPGEKRGRKTHLHYHAELQSLFNLLRNWRTVWGFL